MKNFTILFPTRKRVDKLFNLLYSLMENTYDRGGVEVLVAYDIDDNKTKDAITVFEDFFRDLSLRFYPFERKINKHAYYNELFKYSTGKNVITLNDDTIFKTQSWDAVAIGKINNYLEKYPDGVYYGWIEDNLEPTSKRHGSYCCFPLISRKVVEVLGFVQSTEFLGGGADIFLGNLMHAVQRVIDMKDIVIDHISFHAYKHLEPDDTYNEAWAGYKANPLKRQKPTTEVGAAAEKLRKYIHEYSESHK